MEVLMKFNNFTNLVTFLACRLHSPGCGREYCFTCLFGFYHLLFWQIYLKSIMWLQFFLFLFLVSVFQVPPAQQPSLSQPPSVTLFTYLLISTHIQERAKNSPVFTYNACYHHFCIYFLAFYLFHLLYISMLCCFFSPSAVIFFAMALYQIYLFVCM